MVPGIVVKHVLAAVTKTLLIVIAHVVVVFMDQTTIAIVGAVIICTVMIVQAHGLTVYATPVVVAATINPLKIN
jgi:hypothetical protein